MRISVVIPCFNAEKFIALTIGSVLEQSRLPDEIIVIDDGSTDRSIAVVETFGERVRIISSPRRGACHARNVGYSLSTGDAVMFLDADDLLAPDALAGLVAALQGCPEGVALAPWYRLEKRGDDWVERPPSCRRRRDDEDLLDAWLTGWWHPPCSVMWTREAFESTGGWDPDVAVNQDGDLMMRALIAEIPVFFATSGRAYYRRLPDPSSLSSRRHTYEGRAAQLFVIERIAKMLSDRDRQRGHARALTAALDNFAQEAGEFKDLVARADEIRRGIDTVGSNLQRRIEQLTARSVRSMKALARRGRRLITVNTGAPHGSSEPRIVTYGSSAAYQARVQAGSFHPREPIPRRGDYGGDGVSAFAVNVVASPGRADAAAGGRSHIEVGTGRIRTSTRGKASGRHAFKRSPGRTGKRYEVEVPIVTVVIPTYNRAHVVHRAIDSVLAQTFTDFELLVVDDGSTDGTEVVLSTYDDPRIRYLIQPVNRGVSAARNRGIKEARGQFIAFLDSDDEWFRNRLKRQVNRFRRAPKEVGLLYCGVETVGSPQGTWTFRPEYRGDVYDRLLVRNVIHTGSGVMIRRNIVCAAGFFDEDIPAIEDYEYWLRIARHYRFDFVPEPLMRYYDERNGERKSLDTADNIDAREYFFRRNRREMRRAGVAHEFLRETARRCLRADVPDRRRAGRLAVRAVLENPLDRRHYPFVLYHFLPRLHEGLFTLRNLLRKQAATRSIATYS